MKKGKEVNRNKMGENEGRKEKDCKKTMGEGVDWEGTCQPWKREREELKPKRENI
jgi:hypothetical protein